MSDATLILARDLGEALQKRNWMLGCAESCTGGLLAGAVTDIAGSSEWFDRCFVTYSNAAKMEQLRVGRDTLERFGAVSEETAMEMAAGVLGASQAMHFAISTTGIAVSATGDSVHPIVRIPRLRGVRLSRKIAAGGNLDRVLGAGAMENLLALQVRLKCVRPSIGNAGRSRSRHEQAERRRLDTSFHGDGRRHQGGWGRCADLRRPMHNLLQ